MNRIELLEPSLLANKAVLADIDHWLDVIDRPHGWHYDLDIVWYIESLAKAGITPGMTVLDAGAGLGVTQFILAARGYNIISLDFGKRGTPPRTEGIFTIEHREGPALEYRHSYMTHMDFAKHSKPAGSALRAAAMRIIREPAAATRAAWDVTRKIRRNFERHAEMRRDHSKFGKIEFVQASFHAMPIPDSSVDAVISGSAIEHSDKEVIRKAIAEMRRATKPGGPILITTSATGSPTDTFHEPTQGLCFSRDSLAALAGNPVDVKFDFPRVEREIRNSRLLWSRLDPYYRRWSESVFFGRKQGDEVPYLVVGLKLDGSGHDRSATPIE